MEFSFGASATKILTTTGFSYLEAGDILMILVACIMLYLAIWKKFEPLLLLPIGFGCLLANIPMSTMANTDAGGLLNFFYQGVTHEVLPPLIFLGVGALTDFGPLLANPTTLLLGAAAQIGVYITLIGAVLLGFNMHEASAIGIIGGADGPTSIFIASKLAPHLLAPIAVAAYSYMALVPLIQPPIMKLLTTEKERKNQNGAVEADIPNGEDSFPRGGDHRLLFDATRRHPAFRHADAGQPVPRIRGYRPLARNFGNSFDQHRYYSFGIGRGFFHDR